MQLEEWNPWNVWKRTYDYVEKNYSETMQQSMHEESFAAWMGMCQQWYLFYQDMQNKMMETVLQQGHLPSREDVAQVSSLVIQVEEKVEALEDRFDEELKEQLRDIQNTLKQLQKERG